MFKWAQNTLRKSEAAVLVQQAIEGCSILGPPPFNADAYSTQIVAVVWDRQPALFEGKLGKRPHKMTTAAFALAIGLQTFPAGSEAQQRVHLALGMVLDELMTNGALYDLGDPDRWLMEQATGAYGATAEENRPRQEAVLGGLNL